jgi:hypothetical protein
MKESSILGFQNLKESSSFMKELEAFLICYFTLFKKWKFVVTYNNQVFYYLITTITYQNWVSDFFLIVVINSDTQIDTCQGFHAISNTQSKQVNIAGVVVMFPFSHTCCALYWVLPYQLGIGV